ncbi:undecaprenyl-phosphate glucose phosphotransferase [Enterobacillus tribolii]|uniref:Putative colanic acid biosynthesis UDP-glucose lipid carrier transferase n=1 Tax=Enterobacillus tribolii TaxID=1487935 RepID=A0A370QQV2_9GAMM|nr:undecaprenyl-phosphate glucose phosphotransferase [Enterobacillus tribolii]MBW7981431.1 undecaprenyl-phosphate glucose phosphotransferase [Enterobacillus tribolii]RDK90807.1 putative colanic acid biosynthesis UDP-glucose lipid carrier transferase [Enterobacillus tribolii]
MLNHRLRIRQSGYPVAAKFIDFLFINLSVITISYLFPYGFHNTAIPFSLLFSVVFLLIGEYTGLYTHRIKSLRVREFLRLGGAILLTFIIMEMIRLFMNYFADARFPGEWDDNPFPTLLWLYLIPLLTVLLIRLVLFLRFKQKVIRIAIVGLTPAGLSAERELLKEYAGEQIDLAFYDDREPNRFGYLTRAPYRGKVKDLLEKARRGELDEIYIALPMAAVERIRYFLLVMSDTTVNTYIVPDLYSYSTHTTEIRMIGNMQAVSILSSPFDGGGAIIKRAEDLILGGIITLLITPLMLLIAIGIKLTSRGPVIFRQDRYGLSGQKITVYKFRSMRVMENADVVKQATKNDPRVTRFGSFLRRKSLDELPQFINVLQGRMSIVGPRPHAVTHNEEYRKLVENYMIRHKVKPGITGLAQINGYRGEVDTLDKMEKRVQYDIDYIQGWSLWLDLKIIFSTITKGFTGENAY